MKRLIYKVSAIFLTFAMAASLLTVPAFAQEETTAQVSDAQYAVDLLNVLGIIDGAYDTDLTARVSRAEFAVLINAFTGSATPADTATAPGFKDVLRGSFEEPYINSAVNLGYMLPVNDEYFYPAWEISSADAARSFLLTLGYGVLASNDATFYNFANTLDLYDGVDTADFNRGELYKMMYNALMANVMEPTGFGEDIVYEQMKDITGLYKFHDVIRTSGTITGAAGISLGSGSTADSETGIIELDGNKFINAAGQDMSSVLGREVCLYWRDNRGTALDTAIYAEVTDDKALTLKAEDILDYSSMTYEYEDGTKTKKISVNTPYVVYNGEEYTGAYTKAVMKPENGDVTIVEDVSGKGRDLVIIRSFTDVLVNLVISDNDEQVIIGKNGERYNVGLYEDGVEYYNSYGLGVTLADVKADTLISVAQSATGHKTIVYICPEAITGQITSKEDEIWTIGEAAYAIAPALLRAIAAGAETEPGFNKDYTFHINLSGEIACVTENASALADGVFYAVVTGMNTGTGLSTDVSLRVFSKTMGGFETYSVADKLELNGDRVSRSALVTALMRDGRNGIQGNSFVAQPIKIGLNADNEVNYLFQTASDNSDGKGFFCFMGSTDPATTGTYYQYRNVLAYSKSGGTDFAASPKDNGYKTLGTSTSTEYIQVPYFEDGTIDTATEKAFISTTRPTGSVPYVVYKEKEEDLVAALVIRATASGEKQHCETTFNVHAILSISQGIVDEEVVTLIKTNKMTYYLDNPNIDLNALKIWETVGANGDAVAWIDPETQKQGVHKVVPGDLVNIYTDSMGYIQAMEIVYDSVDKVMMGKGASNEAGGYINSDYMWFSRNGMYNLLLLNVLKIEDGYISATVAEPGDYIASPSEYRHFLGAVPPIICVEQAGNKLTSRNAVNSDIIGYYDSPEDYSQVILSHRYAQQSGTSFVIKK